MEAGKKIVAGEKRVVRAGAGDRWYGVRLGLQAGRCRLPELGKVKGTCSLQNCMRKHFCCVKSLSHRK